MESVTYLKNIKIAPKKLRFYLGSIKKMTPGEALTVLLYAHEKPGRVFYQAIKSAVANAKHTLKVQDDLLQFKALMIEEGQKVRRYRPGSRGSAKPIKKRYSHIKIILSASSTSTQAGDDSKKPVEQTSPKEASAVAKKPAARPKKKTETTEKPPKKKELKVSATNT